MTPHSATRGPRKETTALASKGRHTKARPAMRLGLKRGQIAPKGSITRSDGSIRLQGLGVGAGSLGALAVGAFAVGALAIGAVAVGSLFVRRLKIRQARIGRLKVDDFTVGRLRVAKLERARTAT